MSNLLVVLIVIVAGAYSIRRFYKRLKALPGSCCGCSICTVEKPHCKQSEI
jgi:predicted metal-binding protein